MERSLADPARDQATAGQTVSSVAPVPSKEGELLALQGTVGNAALVRDHGARRAASPISEANLAQMRADVDFIVARLKQQVLDADEENELLNRVRAWAAWDQSYAASGLPGTPFLDRFLTLLTTRTFSRSTARMLFGLAGDEWMSAYDGLFHELEGERGEQLRALVAKSRTQGTAGPEIQQMQSVYGYVGKRVGMGAWGILKQMGLTVMSLADAVIWAQWRQQGLSGDPPQLSPAVAKQFDEAAKVIADLSKQGATPAELERERQELIEEYEFGDRWGKIVGILMSAGMGAGSKGLKAVSMVAQTAQGLQGVETAAKRSPSASRRCARRTRRRPGRSSSPTTRSGRVRQRARGVDRGRRFAGGRQRGRRRAL